MQMIPECEVISPTKDNQPLLQNKNPEALVQLPSRNHSLVFGNLWDDHFNGR
jgi:hypothetical protein